MVLTISQLMQVFYENRDLIGGFMPKDSQPDNKKARTKKAKGQTPITQENMSKNKNSKRRSIENNDV